ncbi:MAG: 2-C-methyl-D-erythritol 2,4-cyclodiphosphate synthase [Candidatus Aminicenantia bacterium]
MKLKIGIGFDIHKLVEGKKLILGGIEIPYEKGLSGHSDGDVVIHAMIDAILGALGEKSIGELFPDTDKKYKDIDSKIILSKVCEMMKEKGMKIMNIDCVIIAEEPKLYPFTPHMKDILAPILEIKNELLGIKAKTHEGMGEIGKKEAIACYSIALLKGK